MPISSGLQRARSSAGFQDANCRAQSERPKFRILSGVTDRTPMTRRKGEITARMNERRIYTS
jgi:hypothetical protein